MSTLNPQAERILAVHLPQILASACEEIKKPEYVTGTTDHGFGVSRGIDSEAGVDGYTIEVRISVDVRPIRPDPEPEA